MLRTAHRSLLAPAALALLAPLATADVLVVDAAGGPGADFTDLQPALDAAGAGDTLLVRPGSYAAASVAGKGLVLVRDGAGPAALDGLTVREVPGNQRFVLRGLDVRDPSGAQPSLVLEDSDGPIWVEDCRVGGAGDGFAFIAPVAGCTASSCEEVVFAACEVDSANQGLFGGLTASAGLYASGSDVHAYDSDFTSVDATAIGADGGAGIRMLDCQLWLSGCTLQGGDGAEGDDGFFQECFEGTDAGFGGPGLEVVALPAVLRRVDSTLAGGVAGVECGPPPPFFAPEIQGTPGFDLELDAPARSLSATSPVREGQTITFELLGAPGEAAFVAVSVQSTPGWIAPFQGVLLVPLAPVTILSAGLANPTGAAEIAQPAPGVPAAAQARTFFAQSVFLDLGAGTAALGGGSAATILDSAF